MAVPVIVKHVGQVNSQGSGFFPGFDNTGTYQPTVGNLVIFNLTRTLEPFPAFPQVNVPGNWGTFNIPVSGDPALDGLHVLFKVWAAGDSTASVPWAYGPDTPTFSNECAWAATEVSGQDPLNPVSNYCLAFGNSTFPDPSFPFGSGYGSLTVPDAENLVFIAVSTNHDNGLQVPPPGIVTATNGFAAINSDPPAVCASPPNIVNAAGSAFTLANPTLGPGLVSSTLLFTSDPDWGTTDTWNVMFSINALSATPPFVSDTGSYTDTEEFYYVLRPQVTP